MSKKKSASFTEGYSFESYQHGQSEQAYSEREFDDQEYAEFEYDEQSFASRQGPSRTIIILRVVWIIAVVAALVIFGIQLIRSSSTGSNQNDTPINIDPPSITQEPGAVIDPTAEQTTGANDTYGPQTTRIPSGGDAVKYTPVPSGMPTDNNGGYNGDARTRVPSSTPSAGSSTPNARPTNPPVGSTNPPVVKPTNTPTQAPTGDPSARPTNTPPLTSAPSSAPTDVPTDKPTAEPSDEPSDKPTQVPTEAPTQEPSDEPTVPPSDDPEPTSAPTDDSLIPLAVNELHNGSCYGFQALMSHRFMHCLRRTIHAQD
ncbi:MAG: PT domain-containing protein [Christensenellaceae bacterium]|nr:PT domain-containing protein [Christensenellaceae bacterium]